MSEWSQLEGLAYGQMGVCGLYGKLQLHCPGQLEYGHPGSPM